MNPYLRFVQQIEAHMSAARALSCAGGVAHSTAVSELDAPTILLFSPHPDDECITGLLPLRLMREAGMNIVNVPVTFGSNPSRQRPRAKELKKACDYLGFQCLEKTASRPVGFFQGLEKGDVVEILKTANPAAVFVPHSKDWNSRHIETHHLVMDSLAAMPRDFSCAVIETEYWGAMDAPNLMVEADAGTLADLVAALSLHAGEVARNPYHLLLPAWMQDNVRRGGELVGGQGVTPPDFSFATLYRLRRWCGGEWVEVWSEGHIVSMEMDAGALF